MGAPAFAQEEPTEPHVVLKPAKERQLQGSSPQDDPTMALKPGVGEDKQDVDREFAQCVGDWDVTSHMTKQEWRSACRRAITDDPGAFKR
jgi:hypothetical protein